MNFMEWFFGKRLLWWRGRLASHWRGMDRLMNIVEKILDECCFIAGGRKSVKTNLGVLLVDQLLKNNVKIRVLDSSRQWMKRSSVPRYEKFQWQDPVGTVLSQSGICPMYGIVSTIAHGWRLLKWENLFLGWCKSTFRNPAFWMSKESKSRCVRY